MRCSVTCVDVFESEFLVVADMAGRNIYQLGLAEGRIVRLLALDLSRRPAALALDELGSVLYWTDVAAASIVSRLLTVPVSVHRPKTVYRAGRNAANFVAAREFGVEIRSVVCVCVVCLCQRLVL